MLPRHNFLKLILLYGVVLGVLLTFFIPITQKPDELTHFLRAVNLSQGHFFCPVDKNGVFINDLPKFITDFAHHPRLHPRLNTIDIASEVKTNSLVACTLPALPYLPVSLLMWPLIITKWPVGMIFMLGRLINLSIGLVIFYWVLKITPKKMILIPASLYLMPMTWHQIGSLSKDSLHLSFGALALALILDLLQNPQQRERSNKIIWLFFSLLVVTISRPQYLPLLLLTFMIKPRSTSFWHRTKLASSFKLTMIIATISLIALSIIMNTYSVDAQKLNKVPDYAYADADYQRQILWQNPDKLISVPYYTFVHHGEFLFQGMVGILGQLNIYFDWYVYLLFGILLGLIIYKNSQRITAINNFQLTLLTMTIIGVVSGLLLAMYLYATRPGNFLVDGLQGRYFLVLLPLVIWWLSEMRRRLGKRFDVAVGLVIIVSLLKTIAE